MTYSDLFSKRYRLRPTPEGLVSEDVPESARIGLYYILEDFFDYISETKLYSNICVALRIPRETRDYNLTNYPQRIKIPIENIIMSCDWWRFYDICEIIHKQISSSYSYRYKAEDFIEGLNKLLIDEQLGFKMRNGKVEKVGSGIINAKVKEARYLLKEPEFKGADEHFGKAINALNVRPKSDAENCIKDAVAAIESVGRVIVHNDKALLNDIIKNAATKGVIPKPLDQTFQKVYAYRGSEPGVAHGAVDSSKVTEAEAELILSMSAAMIIYLVKKRSKLETT